MNCKKVNKKLWLMAEELLSEEDQKSVNNHINQCPHCAGLLENIKESLAIIESEKQQSPDPFFITRLEAKMENQKTPSSSAMNTVFVRVLQPITIAAAVVISLFAGLNLADTNNTQSVNYVEQDNQYTMQAYADEYHLNEITYEVIENDLLNNPE